MKTIKLKDCCIFINGDRSENYPSEKDFIANGIPFVNSGDINDNKIDYTNTHQISKEKFDTLRTGKAEKGDILLTIRGSLGKNTVVSIDKCAIASMFVIIKAKENIDPLYLYYCLNENTFKQKLQKLNNGSIQGNIGVDTLSNIEIPYYDIATQRKIVLVLSKIDTQIQRNNDMVHKLQVLGNTIYSKEIHSTKSFECIDCLRIKTGKEDANFATSNGKYKFFTCSEDTFLCDDFAFEGKSILIAGNGNFNVKFSDGKFNAYQRVYVISDEEKYGNLYYTYMHNIQALSQKANGSIIKFLTLDMLKNIQMPIFDVSINKTLNDIVFKIYCTEEQNKKLYELKSNLLPLLINGQLEI